MREPSEGLWKWSCDKELEGCWEKLGERRVLSTKNRKKKVNLLGGAYLRETFAGEGQGPSQ